MSKSPDAYVERTIEALMETSENLTETTRKQGKIHEPLLQIKLSHIVPDELHLMLRITDVLIRNLINGAIQYDMSTKRTNDILSGEMLNKLLEAIRSCGIIFNVTPNKARGFEFTSLLGPQKLLLLKKLPSKLADCQPAEISNVVKQIWKVKIGIATYFQWFIS